MRFSERHNKYWCLCDVMRCSLLDRRQYVGGTCYLQLQGTAVLCQYSEDGTLSDCTAVTLLFYTEGRTVITLDLLHNLLLRVIIQGDSFGTRPKKMRISQRLFIRF